MSKTQVYITYFDGRKTALFRNKKKATAAIKDPQVKSITLYPLVGPVSIFERDEVGGGFREYSHRFGRTVRVINGKEYPDDRRKIQGVL